MKILEAREVGTGILIEHEGYTNKIITLDNINESATKIQTNGDVIYVECILQKANTKNRNGRIYPRNLLERELNKYRQLVEQRNSFGEICHPDRSDISLKKSDLGILVTDFWWKGDTLWGVIELLTSKKYDEEGFIGCDIDYIADLIKKKCKLGISSRGLGSVKQQGDVLMVQNDFELIGWDLVASPSTPDAYLYKEISNGETASITESIVTSTKQMNDVEKKLFNFLKK